MNGPFLRPIETQFSPLFPVDLVTTRRYTGKTNELLTHFMCNLARFCSEYADQTWTNLRVFDPLAGGGPLVYSWDATSFQRQEMINVVDSVTALNVLNEFIYDQLAHRVIKSRDILVARKESSPA